MPDAPTSSPRPRTSPAATIAGGWAVSGGLGLTVAVTLAIKNPLGLPVPLTALTAIAGGWVIMLLFAPWRSVSRTQRWRERVVEMTRMIETVANSDERAPTRSMLGGDESDELARLGRVVHDVLGEAHARRRENRLLQRKMDDSIRRETDRATVQLRREATTDPLTGLGNRRSLDRKIDELFGPDRRQSRGNVVAMVLDLDLFKAVNDTLGHEVGDSCLAFLGTLLRSTLRREDSAIRLGGDEFIVLMPNQSIEEARAVAQRIAALFGQMPWSYERPARPTLSIGLASVWSGGEEAARELFQNADEALYSSKSAGRNTIAAYEDHPHRAA
ncbi:MAG: GGDEF domain-containing protein [Phycisphaerales bacterium]|nr:GGDEF domain-containing protein [Phycisphaerae bacterium]NNF41524.1 GGDEF domain-containing protein [Phycisphaerales bacterium]NNM26629.1 GGDEF domain-containing protein [Phycisphaerales bacterium]